MLVTNANYVFKDAGNIQQEVEVEDILPSGDMLPCKLLRLWRDGVRVEGEK